MFSYTKQPGETIVGIGIDFAARMDTGETISSHTAVADTGGIVSSSWIEGTKVLATITGGAAGQKAKVTYRATTSAGQVLEGEVLLLIEEK